MTQSHSDQYAAPWARVAILVLALVAAGSISLYFTGSLVPADPAHALVMQNALLLVVFGSALLEHHFTRPAESVVNSLMGIVTLLPVMEAVPFLPWTLVVGYCTAVFLTSLVCVALSTSPKASGWPAIIANTLYRPATVFGQARLLFSIVFLFGIFAFFDTGSTQAATLVAFWGIFVALWPLRLPQALTALLQPRSQGNEIVGHVIRTDSPNLVRVALENTASWNQETPFLFRKPGGGMAWILPLYSQIHANRVIGTALNLRDAEELERGRLPGAVYTANANQIPQEDTWFSNFQQGSSASLAGFVVENSEIGFIRFETTGAKRCHEGMLAWCSVDGTDVYYQVTNGITTEEPLDSDRHGYQIARASQLGIPAAHAGFAKYDWLPQMNSPVFTFGSDASRSKPDAPSSDFLYGVVPHSEFPVTGDFCGNFHHHTAILGVTGSGKTELAFDLIRHSVNSGLKVICIDLTDQYGDRLSDLSPMDLSIHEETAEQLNEKLFDVETGKFGAPDEKKALREFGDTLRKDVRKELHDFLTQEEGRLGLIRLQEISNTKATLWITELFMSGILDHARRNRSSENSVLLVVEEAHTVMPETSTMGVSDFDSKGLVGRISQVALQGRKYGVGLLVIAQRTANVSKTVLTQCNSVLSFSGYDDTSLNFLRNIFGSEHTSIIPNLRSRQLVAFGKIVRTERPIVVEIPYDESKANSDHESLS